MALKRQALKNVTQASWLFGHPVVRADKNSVAYWSRPTTSPLNQKGGGWMPCLYGGVQTGDDWASLYIPVNELPVPKFEEAQWSYYMTGTETMGIGIVIWVHDPDDFDKRAEITQLGGTSGLEKTAGWNAHEFNTATVQMFFYGEGTTGTKLTAGTQYAWTSFQDDTLFSNWTIYRISFDYGWEASGTFDPAWIAEVKLNEIPIPLIPREGDLVPVHQYKTVTSGAIASTLAPKTPFKLISAGIHVSAALATSEVFTATLDHGEGTAYDEVLASEDLYVGTRLSERLLFGDGYEFSEYDEVDFAQANSGNKTIGLDICWQPL